jgi:predicted nicotinamide N-methyase
MRGYFMEYNELFEPRDAFSVTIVPNSNTSPIPINPLEQEDIVTDKKTNEYRFRGVTMPKASHPAIRRIKRSEAVPSIHGDKLWKSSFLLIDYLDSHRPEYCESVVDVGCGWGISGIWCAKTLGSQVISIDADNDVFPYLNAIAHLNDVKVLTLTSRFEKLSKRQLSEFDVLIAADICFWDELVNPVFNMINRAVDAGVKHIFIADPERSSFFAMAERCMQKHCAELIEWNTSIPVSARGAILVIENA